MVKLRHTVLYRVEHVEPHRTLLNHVELMSDQTV